MLRIFAHGHPRPQPRPRFVGGRVVSTLSPLTRAWRETVSSAVKFGMRRTPAWPAGCALELVFVMPTRDKKRHGRPHLNRPDVDNLAKAVMDVLEQRGALPRGDADVCVLIVTKVWGPSDMAGVHIKLYDAPDVIEAPEAIAA